MEWKYKVAEHLGRPVLVIETKNLKWDIGMNDYMDKIINEIIAVEKINGVSNARRIFIMKAVQIAAVQPKRRRYQLAPRRPYSTHSALSNRARDASTTWDGVTNCDN